MKESFIFLAEGFEEMEAVCVIDILRRGGMEVRTVSITSSLQVKGAHGVAVTADVLFDNTLFDNPEWLILPGGLPGAVNLYEYAPLQGLLKRQLKSEDGRIAAICASPALILGKLGVLKGIRATCYPGCEGEMKDAVVVNEPVVVDGKFVTGNGPGNVMPWALKILAEARGAEIAREVAEGLLLYKKYDAEFDFTFG